VHHPPDLEPAHETMEAANTRSAEELTRAPREKRHFRRTQRAAAFHEIDVYVRTRERDGLEHDLVASLNKYLKSCVIEVHRQ
jgi:hypothetical protein